MRYLQGEVAQNLCSHLIDLCKSELFNINTLSLIDSGKLTYLPANCCEPAPNLNSIYSYPACAPHSAAVIRRVWPKTIFKCFTGIGGTTQLTQDRGPMSHSGEALFSNMREGEHTPPTFLQYAECAFSMVCKDKSEWLTNLDGPHSWCQSVFWSRF